MNRTAEAQEKLRHAAEKFPERWRICYNLACYACQLGELDEARALLERAFTPGDAKQVKMMALDDADLSPLFAAGV